MNIKVYRFNPLKDKEPYYEEYEVEHREHMKVLDALDYMNRELGANLAYRSSCRAGQCGACAVRANSKPCLACRRDVEEGMVIEPLRNFPVLKDLVVATGKSYPRMSSLRPYLHRGSRRPDKLEALSQEDLERISNLKDCLQCFSCMSACPVVASSREFAGPLLFRLLARFLHDPRETLDRLPIAVEEGLYLCTTCGACYASCPEEIPTNEEILEMRRMVYEDG